MEMKFKNTFFVLLVFFATVVNVRAQKVNQSKDDIVTEFLSTHDSIKKQKITVQSPPKLEFALETPTGNSERDSIQFFRQLKQYDFAAMHQERSFAWQFYSSILIFVMVIFIVIMGLVLSYKQFKLMEIQVKSNISKPKSETIEVASEDTNIEISQTGLKINTGVIGLAILFLSLAFFFLYLKYVYQIDVIDTGH
jgi:hypothetical protein